MTPFTDNGHAPASSRIPPWQMVEEQPPEPSRFAKLTPEQIQAVVEFWKSGWKSNQRRDGT